MPSDRVPVVAQGALHRAPLTTRKDAFIIMSTFPVRFTVCTYNIWTSTRWPERRQALQRFAQHTLPDILCLQELIADSRAALDEVLFATHQRVDDPFEGWTREGNLYWNTNLFEIVEHGAEQIGIWEEFRRMFWARLRVKDGSNRTILVATAHFTWSGNPIELETTNNVRVPQSRAAVEALNRLQQPDEPQLFMGDLNDAGRPIAILREGGFTDCFNGMGRYSVATYPATPTANGPQQTIDWLMHRGALRPMSAGVIDFYDGDLAPSDHKPVLATYGF